MNIANFMFLVVIFPLGKWERTVIAMSVTCLTQLIIFCDNLRKKWMTHVSSGSNSCLNLFGGQNSKVGFETPPPCSAPTGEHILYNLLCLIVGRTWEYDGLVTSMIILYYMRLCF